MSFSLEEKLKLEMLVTEHERLLEQFSELIGDQQTQIDRLKRKLELLEQKLEEDKGDGVNPLADEPPPHY